MQHATTPEWAEWCAGLSPSLAALHADPPAYVLSLPDGGEITVGDLVEVLREQVAPPPGDGRPLAVRDDRYAAGLIAAAWRHTVHGQVRAVLLLLDAGLDAEALANARVALEHAVELVRLAAAADNDGLDPLLEALVADQQRRQARHLDHLSELDRSTGGQHTELIAEGRDLIGPPGPKDKTRPATIAARFAAIPSGAHFYDVYGRLSESTHAGMTSAAAYLGLMSKHGGPVPARPDPTAWAEVLALLCWSCWAADDAMLRFVVGGGPAAARHAPLMARVGLAAG